jgi:hypothetical protein
MSRLSGACVGAAGVMGMGMGRVCVLLVFVCVSHALCRTGLGSSVCQAS